MTEFEFLSVLISIIFGLGLTHVLTGSMRYIYARRATEARLVYSLFTLYPPDEVGFTDFETRSACGAWISGVLSSADLMSTDRIPLHGGGQSSHMSWFGKSPVGETYFDD